MTTAISMAGYVMIAIMAIYVGLKLKHNDLLEVAEFEGDAFWGCLTLVAVMILYLGMAFF